jgi:hypothetical protein
MDSFRNELQQFKAAMAKDLRLPQKTYKREVSRVEHHDESDI